MTLPVSKLVRDITPFSEVKPLFCHVPSIEADISLTYHFLSDTASFAALYIDSFATVSTTGEIILDSLINF